MEQTFKEFLSEQDEDTSTEYLFNFQVMRLKIIHKLKDVISDDENLIIEFMDIIQMIKLAIIDNMDNDTFIEDLNLDVKKSLKLMYPNSSTEELNRTINKEMLVHIENSSIEKIKDSMDLNELGMNSKDEFGKLLYRLYTRDLKDEINDSDVTIIKKWINKIQRTEESLISRIRHRIHLKDKMYSKLTDEIEEPELDDDEEK